MRIGKVSSVSAEGKTARVFFPDINIVSGDLKIMKQLPTFEPALAGECKNWVPSVNDIVVCEFLQGGDGEGVILGGVL